MPQAAIFEPVFATVFLTFVVWVYMYVRRIHFLTTNNIDPSDMAVPGALARISAPEVVNPSDNLKNLFEIPVIFYALALYLFVTGQVDAAYVAAAWIFVVFRALHSAVHCTINIVTLRFYLYLVSALAVWFIAGRAAFPLPRCLEMEVERTQLPSNPRLQRRALRAIAEPADR